MSGRASTRMAQDGIRRAVRPRDLLPALIAALSCVFAPLPVTAQLGLERSGAGVGTTFEFFSFADPTAVGIESLSLLTVPFAGRAEITSRLALVVNGAWARGALKPVTGSERSVAGLTDTEVRATFGIGNDALNFSAIALLPTGHATLDADEAEVAGAVAADVLPFRISNWGTGGGFGASVAAARALGRTASAGFSVGWVAAREFEPVLGQADFVYRPGNQLHLTGAIDASVGASTRGSLRISYQRYDTDRANGANLYQSGDRLQVTGSWAFAAGPSANGIVYAGVQHRDRGEHETGALSTPSQDLILAGVGGRMPLGRGVLQPTLDIRVLSGAEDAPRGYTAGLGVSAEFPVGAALLVPTVRARIGDARTPSDTGSRYSGAELGMAIRFGGR